MLSTIDFNPRSTHPPPSTRSPSRLSTESKHAQKERLARGKLLAGPESNGSHGATLDRTPGNQRRRALLARFRPGACRAR